MALYQVAVNFPHHESILTYEGDSEDIQIGSLVEVPLGRRKEKGIVVSEEASSKFDKLKKILSVLNQDIKISKAELALYQWMSNYYHYSLGKLIFDCLPKMLKRPKNLNWVQGKSLDLGFDLNDSQQKILDSIKDKGLDKFSRSLIHGVTGSGKTAIYINLIKETLKNNKSALFLVPEINLTPQFISVFTEHLDCEIYNYHSGISNSEKYQLWKLLPLREKPVLIMGVRSSIFLPIKNLGIIIVDEEHDGSFKQDDRCPYNAKDVAIKKASLINIPIILGSATPSVENFHQMRNSESYYSLKHRIGTSRLPDVELIDLRGDEKLEHWPVHDRAIEKISSALKKKEQVLVFVNKLGHARFLQCRGCGHRFMCTNCSVTLTPYLSRKSLECHHCSFKIPMPTSCPECNCLTLSHKGYGTEKVQTVLQSLFKDSVVERFDRDEIKTATQIEEKLNRFNAHEIDIFVGTQMLSKGHNFRRVNTVIILGADSQLNFPDFRSEEKVYQLLTQVTGRAGRYGDDSNVLLQTYQPDYDLFKYIKNHEFDEFYFKEIQMRKLAMCPPFKRLATISFHGRFQNNVTFVAQEVTNELKSLVLKHFADVQILGPRPSMIEKRANKFSWITLLKSENLAQLHNLLKTFEMNYKKHKGIEYKVDIDPQFLN